MIFRSAIVLALVASFLVVPSSPPRIAHACSGGFEGTTRERFESAYSFARAAVLAEVVDSRVIQPGGGPVIGPSGAPLLVQADGTIATFNPAVLWSNDPLAGNTVGPLGYVGADCSGGPSLEPGDKVFLFLSPQQQYPIADYRIGVFGDTVLFRGEEAFFLHAGDYEVAAGRSWEILELLISVAGSAEITRDAAYSFLGIEPPTIVPVPGIRPPAAGDAGLR